MSEELRNFLNLHAPLISSEIELAEDAWRAAAAHERDLKDASGSSHER